MKRILFLSGLFFIALVPARADEPDSLRHRQMREVAVSARSVSLPGETEQGRLYWNMQSLEHLPHLFGTADPVRFLQMLPGVSTNNDYTSGLHIQGCSTAHHLIELNGAPVFNASHLLGLFSIFTPSHFRGMSLVKNSHDAAFANRLGGKLSFHPIDSLARRVHLNATFSFMESEGTLTLPTGPSSTLYLSGRGSYLNACYKNVLKIDEAKARYGLQDYTLTYILRPDERNRLNLTFYKGTDRFSMRQKNFGADGNLEWGNTLGSAEWEHHTDRHIFRQSVYTTYYRNAFDMHMEGMQLQLTSDIVQTGYKSKWENTCGPLPYDAGVEYTCYITRPLKAKTEGAPTGVLSAPDRQQAHEASLFADIRQPLGRYVTCSGGMRLSLFRPKHRTYADASPRLTVTFSPNRQHRLSFHYGLYRQYLHQLSLANGSFPIDYRTPATPELPPQTSHSLTLGYRYLSPGGGYELSTEVYYKRLNHQLEYSGAIFDLFTAGRSITDLLMQGKGNNYGIDLMLKRNRGTVTGWVAYTLGRCDRHFPVLESSHWFPSAFDRRHDLTAVFNYRLNRHWSLGGDFVYASGTPYTRTQRIYILNNSLISEYGRHNGARLSASHRLDLSATYHFGLQRKCRQTLNLSVFNVYGHDNELFRYMGFQEGHYATRSVYSLCRLLPSAGYTLTF